MMPRSAPHRSTLPDGALLYLRPQPGSQGRTMLCGSAGGRRGWRGAVDLPLLSGKSACANQSCRAHEFGGWLGGWEVAAWELGPCQGSGPGLVSARPRLAKSGWVATENKPHPLMPPASHTKSLIACRCLRISRCPPCCQLSCKMEIASFVTGSMPCNTSGSRVLAVFVLCSQRETICW